MIPKQLEEYIEASKKAKEAEAIMDRNKKYVQKFLRRCKRWNIKLPVKANLIKNERFEFNGDNVLEWLKDHVNARIFERVTKTVVDLEQLNEVYLDGLIDTTEMPTDCYSSKTYYSVRIGK